MNDLSVSIPPQNLNYMSPSNQGHRNFDSKNSVETAPSLPLLIEPMQARMPEEVKLGRDISNPESASLLTISNNWLLNTLQLTPPYSPGNGGCKFCHTRETGCEQSCSMRGLNSSNQKYSHPSTDLLSAAAISFPNTPSPRKPENSATSNLSAIPSKSLTSKRDQTRTPPPPCCQVHANSYPVNFDSEVSIIQDACIGNKTCSDIVIPSWAVGMTAKELEIRLQLSNVRKLYRIKQKELISLKRASRQKTLKKAPRVESSATTQPNQVGPSTPKQEPQGIGKKRSHSGGRSLSSAEDESRNRSCSPNWKVAAGKKNAHTVPLVNLSVKRVESGEFSEEMTPRIPNSISSLEEEAPSSPEKEVSTSSLKISTAIPSDPLVSDCENVTKATEPQYTDERAISLSPADLYDGVRLMLLEGGLFYTGTLKVINADALLYGFQIDGQRAGRPYILCLEDVLNSALNEVRVEKIELIPPGSRVCAVWSGQLKAMYPGTIRKATPGKAGLSKQGEPLIGIDFDDGDSGQIPLSDIRLIPQNFPITKVKSPVLPEFITRSRRSKGASADEPPKEGGITPRRGSDPNSKTSRRGSGGSEASTTSPRKRELLTKHDWDWAGQRTQDQKRRRICYEAISKGPVTVKLGDLIHLQPTPIKSGEPARKKRELPYVGIVKELWETKGKSKRVCVAWCYRAEEINHDVKEKLKDTQLQGGVFRSTHIDDNSVETISARCNLLSYQEYRRKLTAGEDLENVHFFAGTYNPVTKKTQLDDDLLNQ